MKIRYNGIEYDLEQYTDREKLEILLLAELIKILKQIQNPRISKKDLERLIHVLD